MQKFYFDDAETGLDRATCHPLFRKYCSDDFYYDILDDFSPFGNDDGADTLYELEEWLKQYADTLPLRDFLDDLSVKWAFEVDESEWDLLDRERIVDILHDAPYAFDLTDRVFIATAFGQVKVSGTLSQDIKDLADCAFARQMLIVDIYQYEEPLLVERLKQMQSDLAACYEEIWAQGLPKLYIHRGEKLEEIEHITWKNLDSYIDVLNETTIATYFIFENEAGFLQCAGADDEFIVEFRDVDENDFHHFILGKEPITKKRQTFNYGGVSRELFGYEVLSIDDVTYILESFYQHHMVPREYLMRNISKEFQ